MCLSNTEPLTSLSCPLNVVFHVIRGPVPQDAGTPLLSLLQMFNLFIDSIAVLENVSPSQGYRKETPFAHSTSIALEAHAPHHRSRPLTSCQTALAIRSRDPLPPTPSAFPPVRSFARLTFRSCNNEERKQGAFL
jgi:hypothetical protein